MQSGDQRVGIDVAADARSTACVSSSAASQSGACKPTSSRTAAAHLVDRAATQLVTRFHRRAILEDEREPSVVVDGGVRAPWRVDRDPRREVLVEAEFVPVAARRHELARGGILRGELSDHAARRAGYLTIESEVVPGADAHQPGADGLGRRLEDRRIADPTAVTEHLGEELGGDVAVGAEHGVVHRWSGIGIRSSEAMAHPPRAV